MCGGPRDISTVIVNGSAVIESGRAIDIDEELLVKTVQDVANKVWESRRLEGP